MHHPVSSPAHQIPGSVLLLPYITPLYAWLCESADSSVLYAIHRFQLATLLYKPAMKMPLVLGLLEPAQPWRSPGDPAICCGGAGAAVQRLTRCRKLFARGCSLARPCHLLRVVLVQAAVSLFNPPGTAQLHRSGSDAEILVQVRIETLVRQNEELESKNAALEIRNTFLETANAELTAQNRNAVIRNHAIEKEVRRLGRDVGSGFPETIILHCRRVTTAEQLRPQSAAGSPLGALCTGQNDYMAQAPHMTAMPLAADVLLPVLC